jgi:hypothetical protein
LVYDLTEIDSQYFGADGGRGLYADPEVKPMVKAFFATYLK